MIRKVVEVRALDFGDNLECFEFIGDVDIIVAGDIIYDNAITEKFMGFLHKCHKKKAKSVSAYIALEKRFEML